MSGERDSGIVVTICLLLGMITFLCIFLIGGFDAITYPNAPEEVCEITSFGDSYFVDVVEYDKERGIIKCRERESVGVSTWTVKVERDKFGEFHILK